jgi:hypothetical protein
MPTIAENTENSAELEPKLTIESVEDTENELMTERAFLTIQGGERGERYDRHLCPADLQSSVSTLVRKSFRRLGACLFESNPFAEPG